MYKINKALFLKIFKNYTSMFFQLNLFFLIFIFHFLLILLINYIFFCLTKIKLLFLLNIIVFFFKLFSPINCLNFKFSIFTSFISLFEPYGITGV